MHIIKRITTILTCGFMTAAQAQKLPEAHDPVMIRSEGKYYVFSTGEGIGVLSSADREHWRREAPVFTGPQEWAVQAVPGYNGHIWAPDVIFYNGTYYLFYSVSTFGKNNSCIGVVSNPALDPGDPDFKWTDHGMVVRSVAGRDDWNAIDPNVIIDEEGTPWMCFGSFWSGIKLVKLASGLTSLAQPEEWYSIAARPGPDRAIEAPFIFRKGDFYYLFVSYDYCCRGTASTYNVRVGRSRRVTGPYHDKTGADMTCGGGTPVVKGNDRWHGVGHNAVNTFDGTDYLIFHGYDALNNGRPELLVRPIDWDEAGWPTVKL